MQGDTLATVTVTNVSANGVGTYGTLSMAANGDYTYTLNNDSVATQGLTEGQQVTETFTYTITDSGGETDQAVLTFNIDGTNDAAIVSSADVALDEINTALFSEGTLTSSDVDNPDNTFTASSTAGQIGTFAIDALGAWTFDANQAFDSLNVGGSVSETYDVTSVDGTQSSVTITIDGTNDGAIVSQAAETISGAVDEDTNATTTGDLAPYRRRQCGRRLAAGAVGVADLQWLWDLRDWDERAVDLQPERRKSACRCAQ